MIPNKKKPLAAAAVNQFGYMDKNPRAPGGHDQPAAGWSNSGGEATRDALPLKTRSNAGVHTDMGQNTGIT